MTDRIPMYTKVHTDTEPTFMFITHVLSRNQSKKVVPSCKASWLFIYCIIMSMPSRIKVPGDLKGCLPHLGNKVTATQYVRKQSMLNKNLI